MIMGGMTMAPYEDDDVPTLREVSRTLRDFRDEFRLQMSAMVRKDVHVVEHQNLDARHTVVESRVTRLEVDRDNDRKDKTTVRNQFYFSVVAAALSLIVAIIVSVVK
jgi:hypothetical protein